MIKHFAVIAVESALALTIVAAMWAVGAKTLSAAGFPGFSDDDAPGGFTGASVAFFSLAAGYTVFSALFFFAGVAGLYHRWFAFLCVAAALAWGFRPRRFYRAALSFEGFWFPFFPFLAAAFALALMPPHYYDSLVYHLALPAEYIKSNSIAPLPHNLYSHFPQNAEMIFVFALLLSSGVAANLVTFFVGAALAAGVFALSKKYVSSRAAALAVGLFASAPFFLFLSSSTYVEIHQAFLSLAAFWAFLEYAETGEKKFLALSGAFSGAAIGVKYTAAASCAAINVLLFVRLFRRKADLRAAALSLCAFNAIALAVVAPWLVKNAVFTGNPVFPFFYRLFGFAGTGWNAASAAGYFATLTEYAHRSSVFYELVTLPYNIFFNPVRYGGGIDVLGDFGWPALIMLAPLAIFYRRKMRFGGYALLYTAAVFAIWHLTKPVLRFLVPAAPMLSVLAALVVSFAAQRKSLPLKLMVYCAYAAALGYNIFYFVFIAGHFRPMPVITGAQPRGHYLAGILRNSPYQAFEFVNSAAPSGKIFFVGEQRSFYCAPPLDAPSVVAPNPLVGWADASSSPTELLETVKLKKFTHIFYNIPEGERLAPYGVFNFSEKGRRNWLGLLDKLKKNIVYYDGVCVIYDIH